MSNTIEIKCPVCGHTRLVNLDDYTAVNTIYRRYSQEVEKLEYRFRCEECDVYFIVPVTINKE